MDATVPFPPELTDYHVHCHLDGCSAPDMTLAGIYEEAVKTGLREICVVKHYSHRLPNGGDIWVNWKRTKTDAFDAFLREFETTPQPAGLHVLAGVETELLNSDGEVNIPAEAAARIDCVLVSNHWMPEAPGLSRAWQPLLGKGILPCNMPVEDLGPWMDELKKTGAEPYVKAVCDGNAAAVRCNTKARILSHLGDGFHVLRGFRVPVDSMNDDRLMELSIPVMEACVATGALWELTPGVPQRSAIVHEANRRGVSFTGTVDAHFLRNPAWGHTLSQHGIVEETIRRLGVRRARLQPAEGRKPA